MGQIDPYDLELAPSLWAGKEVVDPVNGATLRLYPWCDRHPFVNQEFWFAYDMPGDKEGNE